MYTDTNTPTKVLLTGGRAPAALELARAMANMGVQVYVAESQAYPLCKGSSAVTCTYKVPSPRHCTDAYLKALEGIVEKEHISCVIPTCEEVFYMAKGAEALRRKGCRVWVPSSELLFSLHNKWDFIQRLLDLGKPVPNTYWIDTLDVLNTLPTQEKGWVFKPVYSRFASKTRIFKNTSSAELCKEILKKEEISQATPWVAQGYVEGTEICTYGVAYEGRLLAHSAYVHSYRAGQGAGICFTAIDDEDVYQWVVDAVAAWGYTGQIAFDMIRNAQGVLVPLECNPRATSGVHFLAQHPDFVDVFLQPEKVTQTLRICEPHTKMIAAAMCMYGIASIHSFKDLKHWLRSFGEASDIVWDVKDLWPVGNQFFSVVGMLAESFRMGIPLLEASTYDIEWNGSSCGY